jgi:hypothetical protein
VSPDAAMVKAAIAASLIIVEMRFISRPAPG